MLLIHPHPHLYKRLDREEPEKRVVESFEDTVEINTREWMQRAVGAKRAVNGGTARQHSEKLRGKLARQAQKAKKGAVCACRRTRGC